MIDRMTIPEVEELLTLKNWSKRDLAKRLLLTEDAVYRWFYADKVPRGPALVLMKHWLTEAKKGLSMPAAT